MLRETPHIVGLDISLTSTGVCVMDPSGRVCTYRLGQAGHRTDDWRMRSQRIRDLADSVCELVPSGAFVVIEGPSYGSVSSSTWDRAGLWHAIYSHCIRQGCRVSVVPPVVCKRFFTGTTTASKKLMLATAHRMLGRTLASDDEADAYALALMGAHHMGVYIDSARDSFSGVWWDDAAV